MRTHYCGQLSSALIGVLSQCLMPKKPEGVVAAYEMMVVTPAIANLIRECMLVLLKLGGPLLLIGLVIGLVISVLQAITQINEATLAFVPKVIAMGAGATAGLSAFDHLIRHAAPALAGV